MKRKNIYTGILGLTGSGKSTLARLLRQLGFLHLEEPFSANPFLVEFYASKMKRLALHSQVFFLVRKWALTMSVRSLTEFFSVSIDPDIRGDRYMYVPALLKMESLTKAEFNLYQMVADALMRELPVPDLLVYCRVSPEVVRERIGGRGRTMEQAISLEYLQLQQECLEEWLEGYRDPVLVLDLDKLDTTAEEGAQAALKEVETILRANRYIV